MLCPSAVDGQNSAINDVSERRLLRTGRQSRDTNLLLAAARTVY